MAAPVQFDPAMLPINPLPPLRAVRPLLMIGLAAGAAAIALWARRQVKTQPRRAVRVEPAPPREVADVPWVLERDARRVP